MTISTEQSLRESVERREEVRKRKIAAQPPIQPGDMIVVDCLGDQVVAIVVKVEPGKPQSQTPNLIVVIEGRWYDRTVHCVRFSLPSLEGHIYKVQIGWSV